MAATADDHGRPSRRGLLRGLAAFGTAAAAAPLAAPYAAGDSAVATGLALLTQAVAIENSLVDAYDNVLAMPIIAGEGGDSGILRRFVRSTAGQHSDHLSSFQAVLRQLAPDVSPSRLNAMQPQLQTLGAAAAGGLTSIGAIIDMLLQLENIAAQTYCADLTRTSDAPATQAISPVVGVEAEHVCALRVMGSVLAAGGSLGFRTRIDGIPPSATAAGFPDALFPTTAAISLTGTAS